MVFKARSTQGTLSEDGASKQSFMSSEILMPPNSESDCSSHLDYTELDTISESTPSISNEIEARQFKNRYWSHAMELLHLSMIMLSGHGARINCAAPDHYWKDFDLDANITLAEFFFSKFVSRVFDLRLILQSILVSYRQFAVQPGPICYVVQDFAASKLVEGYSNRNTGQSSRIP